MVTLPETNARETTNAYLNHHPSLANAETKRSSSSLVIDRPSSHRRCTTPFETSCTGTQPKKFSVSPLGSSLTFSITLYGETRTRRARSWRSVCWIYATCVTTASANSNVKDRAAAAAAAAVDPEIAEVGEEVVTEAVAAAPVYAIARRKR